MNRDPFRAYLKNLTPEQYEARVKVLWGEWHADPVSDEVERFARSVQADMRFNRNIRAIREQLEHMRDDKPWKK